MIMINLEHLELTTVGLDPWEIKVPTWTNIANSRTHAGSHLGSFPRWQYRQTLGCCQGETTCGTFKSSNVRNTFLLVLSGESGNGMTIARCYGSLPHSLLSTVWDFQMDFGICKCWTFNLFILVDMFSNGVNTKP